MSLPSTLHGQKPAQSRAIGQREQATTGFTSRRPA
jgi:hypothetical protein